MVLSDRLERTGTDTGDGPQAYPDRKFTPFFFLMFKGINKFNRYESPPAPPLFNIIVIIDYFYRTNLKERNGQARLDRNGQVSENEGDNFWIQVPTNLNNRGLQDILNACTDNLKGITEAILGIFPKTQVQKDIVHHPDSYQDLIRLSILPPGIKKSSCAI